MGCLDCQQDTDSEMQLEWMDSQGCLDSKDCLAESLQVQHHIVLEDLLDWTGYLDCWDHLVAN